jgi:YVTN family beta-propeller protein
MLLRAFVFLHFAFAVTLPGTVLAQSLGPRQSGPIVLSDGGGFLLNVNPDANSVSLFDVSGDQLTKTAEIPVGRDPSGVTIHPNEVTAYVANSYDGTVSVIDVPARHVTKMIRVGAEPAAVALSPNGSRLYVANSASNNLVVINTVSQTVAKVVDLSPYGTAPRAIAVTNNGDTDDLDETVFVALFFAQLRTGKTSTDEGQDNQREGHVVAIAAATDTPLGFNPVRLGPVANTGFKSNGKLVPKKIGGQAAVPATNPQTFTTLTAAFPNQLAAVAIRPSSSQAYVVSTGASPNGPFRFDSNVQGLVSIFDTGTGAEVTAGQTDPLVRRTAPLNLNRGINLTTTPKPRLFLSNPVAMAWRPDGSDAWIVIQNSDLVVRLTVNGSGIPTIGAPLVAGPSSLVRVDLQDIPDPLTESQVPRGIVINATGTRAYVANFIARSVTAIDIANPLAPAILTTAGSATLPQMGPAAAALLGASLFFTSRGPDGRMSKESWGGCAHHYTQVIKIPLNQLLMTTRPGLATACLWRNKSST